MKEWVRNAHRGTWVLLADGKLVADVLRLSETKWDVRIKYTPVRRFKRLRDAKAWAEGAA